MGRVYEIMNEWMNEWMNSIIFLGGVIVFNSWYDPGWSDYHESRSGHIKTKLQSFVDEKICLKWSHTEITFYSRNDKKADVWILTKA